MAWLLRGTQVLASLEVADSFVARNKGLLGRRSMTGAMLLRKTNGVHSVGLRFELDIAWLDNNLEVLSMRALPRWRVALPKKGAKSMLEAEAGAFERWELKVGDRLEIQA